MKIAYYLPSLQAPGGIERIVTFKANYFAEHFEGYDITIITSEQMGTAPHFPLSPKVKHIDLGVSFDLPYSQSIVSKVLKYPFRYYRFKQRLSNLLNELKPDITISTMRRELNFITKLKDGEGTCIVFQVFARKRFLRITVSAHGLDGNLVCHLDAACLAEIVHL